MCFHTSKTNRTSKTAVENTQIVINMSLDLLSTPIQKFTRGHWEIINREWETCRKHIGHEHIRNCDVVWLVALRVSTEMQ